MVGCAGAPRSLAGHPRAAARPGRAGSAVLRALRRHRGAGRTDARGRAAGRRAHGPRRPRAPSARRLPDPRRGGVDLDGRGLGAHHDAVEARRAGPVRRGVRLRRALAAAGGRVVDLGAGDPGRGLLLLLGLLQIQQD